MPCPSGRQLNGGRMETPCRGDSRMSFRFHPEKQYYAGGLPANQRPGLSQHALFAGVRSRWQALPKLQRNACPHCHRRQEQRILPKLPKGLVHHCVNTQVLMQRCTIVLLPSPFRQRNNYKIYSFNIQANYNPLLSRPPFPRGSPTPPETVPGAYRLPYIRASHS